MTLIVFGVCGIICAVVLWTAGIAAGWSAAAGVGVFVSAWAVEALLSP